jgi:arsenate reductase
VPAFVAAQLVGLAVGVGLLLALYPGVGRAAAEVVVARPGRLRALTPVRPLRRNSRAMNHKPSVLFVCVHNAGRSQMAAGWLRHLAGDSVEVRSAGSEPADQINPVAVQAMREVGIDITADAPRRLDYRTAEASDVLVTMGCGDACPVFPGKRYLDWKLDDPAGQGIDAVRLIRDEIRGRVEHLLTEMPAPAGT